MNLDYARHQMVEQQVRCWDVSDPSILGLLGSLPRDSFVPPRFAHLAYADSEIPLPCRQRMMAPLVEGRMLQSLNIAASDMVLEIGSGSGFMTACLGKLGATVISVDIHRELVAMAQANLDDARIGNVSLHQMDAMRGLPPGQYDVIAVTASMPRFDQRFADALKVGGRLFAVVGEAPVMEARRITRESTDSWVTEVLFETQLAPLQNAAQSPHFTF
ncbi:MAG: protein-L-isoaspartate O-methyltransferase [Gammaproteobacteria bacterium]|nr:protein-L-isoaspartate O-methyltransferase [Gammaproteobacteria bacterium]